MANEEQDSEWHHDEDHELDLDGQEVDGSGTPFTELSPGFDELQTCVRREASTSVATSAPGSLAALVSEPMRSS